MKKHGWRTGTPFPSLCWKCVLFLELIGIKYLLAQFKKNILQIPEYIFLLIDFLTKTQSCKSLPTYEVESGRCKNNEEECMNAFVFINFKNNLKYKAFDNKKKSLFLKDSIYLFFHLICIHIELLKSFGKNSKVNKKDSKHPIRLFFCKMSTR